MIERPMFCLVGKFFTSSSPPPSINKSEVSVRWKLTGKMTVSTVENDLILFNFELETDMKKALGDSWHVNGVTLVLKEWPSHLSLSDIDFSFAWFWVKVEGLPLSRYIDEEIRRIGEMLSEKLLGTFHVDPSKREFWVRAEIDLKKPLNPGFFMGKKQKRSFVQFKYKNLGGFCQSCGMIDHPSCGKTPAERPLTRNCMTRVYGPWLRWTLPSYVHDLIVEFPEKITERTEEEETVPYEQFFVKLKVEVSYVNEHKWRDKILSRSISDSVNEYRFRFPCSYLATTLEESTDPSRALYILTREIDENVPIIGLTFQDKVKIVERFVDYSKKNVNSWSDRTWVPVRICVKKTTKLSSVDFQTKIQGQEDKEFCQMIDEKISEMIKRRVENNENVLSLPLWETRIQDLMAQMGVDEIPLGLPYRTLKARREAISYGVGFFSGPIPAEATSVQKLERVRVSGQDMDSLEACAICQEGMFLGDQATRMPCSHLLHTVCIEEWLKKGNQCPLCRFELPSQKRTGCPRPFNRYRRLKRRHL